MNVKASRSFVAALDKAKKLAKAGPRVAAVLALSGNGKKLRYAAVPGYMDSDTDGMKQVRLLTPDGREWMVIQ